MGLTNECGARRSGWDLRLAGSAALLGAVLPQARADGFDLTVPQASIADAQVVAAVTDTRVDTDGLAVYFARWGARVAHARATQPRWSSPLVTTTGLLEQRVRFDGLQQHSGNGTDTTVLGADRGVDLIVSETNEIQVAIPPYYIRTGVTGTGPSDRGAIPSLAGFSDWPYLRVEQRLASSPASGDDYVLTAWISFQAPTGIARLSSNAWTYTPTLAFGKGFGNFVVQGTVAAIFPAPTFPTGNQIQTNIAFQYHAWNVFWPEVEVNWTYYANGQRGGLNQVFLTTGVVIGRFSLTDTLHFTFGAGYLFAVAPTYQPKPQIPSYNHAWLFTTRMNF
ncbi:MAG: hypothetical protein J0I21_03655 [Alphaproteobacteria bacterium]|nr:hypothetical protein [Alphaproteobacteria bacterium]